MHLKWELVDLKQGAIEVGGDPVDFDKRLPGSKVEVGLNSARRATLLLAPDDPVRSAVLPVAHTVDVKVTVNGQPVTSRASVSAQVNVVTYLQFTVRNGQVVPNTWTSQGTTPF